jgi:hypothetical protein
MRGEEGMDGVPSVDDMAKYAEVLEEEEGRGGEGRRGEGRGGEGRRGEERGREGEGHGYTPEIFR